MKIATAVYRRFMAARGIRRSFWSSMRTALIRLFDDPSCTLPIHGRLLSVPLSHALPYRLGRLPFYDRLPQRVSEYIHSKYEHLNCIDVGANIGDTLAAFYRDEKDTFLAIEPNPKFNTFLVENWGWNRNVTVESCMCSSQSAEGTFEIKETTGTASIHGADNGIQMTKSPLDEIVARHASAADANVVKIDTDGYDFEVIAGAQKLLSANHPALLFECADMKKPDYVEECLTTLELLKEIGYSNFLLYDNYGYLMGRYSLSELNPFRNLLFYQLTSRFYYFDVLCMKDEDIGPFYKNEVRLFTDRLTNAAMRPSALLAANIE